MSWRLYPSRFDPVQVTAAPETVTVDKWYAPLVDPQRSRLGLPTQEQQSAAYVGAAPFAEAVSPDRFHFQHSEPVRRKGLAVSEQQAVAFIGTSPFAESVTIDRWQQPFTEPVRYRIGLPVREQQATIYIGASPFAETVSADRWHQPTSQPTIAKRKVQPDGVSYSYYVAPSSEVVTVDKWFREFSTPVHFRAGLPVPEQQSFAFVKASPFAETVSADRWVQETSQPTRRVASRAQIPTLWPDPYPRPGVNYVPAVYPDRADARKFASAEQQSVAFVKAAPFAEYVSVDRWLAPLVQPPARRVSIVAALQQSTALCPVPLPNAVTLGAGYLSIYPDRAVRPALLTASQQSVIFATAIVDERGQSLVCADISIYSSMSVSVSLDVGIGGTPDLITAAGGSVDIGAAVDAGAAMSDAVGGSPDVQSVTSGEPDTKDC